MNSYIVPEHVVHFLGGTFSYRAEMQVEIFTGPNSLVVAPFVLWAVRCAGIKTSVAGESFVIFSCTQTHRVFTLRHLTRVLLRDSAPKQRPASCYITKRKQIQYDPLSFTAHVTKVFLDRDTSSL